MLTAKEHIAAIYQAVARNDRNSVTLAQTLTADIETAYAGRHKYIFELLQNADDAFLEDKPLSVSFIAIEGYLIFQHNGRHFSQEDVDAICDNGGKATHKKANDVATTGYKNLGFKTVFTVSDCVSIISHSDDPNVNYQFTFRQDYTVWQKAPKDKPYPWQITPIWLDEKTLPKAVRKQLNPERVNTVIQFKRHVNLQSELDFILANPEMLLFLKHIKTLTVKTPAKTTILSSEEVDDDRREITLDNKPIGQWLLSQYTVPVSEKLRQQLAALSDKACPRRLKTVKETAFTLACRLENNRILPEQNGRLYNVLPTQFLFPFFVDADFLLNNTRENLLDNPWNQFLLKMITMTHFEWLQELSQTDHQSQMLHLLLPPTLSRDVNFDQDMQEAYASGYRVGEERFSFLPLQRDPRVCVRATACTLDETGFFAKFPETIAGENKKSLILNDLENLSALNPFSPKKLNAQFVLSNLQSLIAKHPTPAFAKRLLLFLAKLVGGDKNHLASLSSEACILTEKNTYAKPGEVYFAPDNNVVLPSSITISLVKKVLYQQSKDIKTWLTSLGISPANSINLIRRHVIAMIRNDRIRSNNAVEIARFVFLAYRSNLLTKKDINALQDMPLLTQQASLAPPFQCYLSDVYQPPLRLETSLTNLPNYVSANYLRQGEDPARWRDFFKELRVHIQIHFRIRHDLTRRRALLENYLLFKSYFTFLKSNHQSPNRAMPAKDLNKHILTNFVEVSFIEHLADPNYAKHFWPALVSVWHVLAKKLTQAKYKMPSKVNDVTAFLVYYLTSVPCIMALDGQLYRTTECYLASQSSPDLTRIVARTFPVAKLPVQLTEEMAKTLGFKTTLSLVDCLRLLDDLNTRKASSLEYGLVFQQILRAPREPVGDEALSEWPGKLLASDCTLQPGNKVYYFADTHQATPKTDNWLLEPPNLSSTEMHEICLRMKIPIIEANTRLLTVEDQIERPEVLQHIVKLLPFLALYESDLTNQDVATLYLALQLALQSVQFFGVSSLLISYPQKATISPMPQNAAIDKQEDSEQWDLFLIDKWTTAPWIRQEVAAELCRFLKLSDNTYRAFGNLLNTIETKAQNAWIKMYGYESRVSELLLNTVAMASTSPQSPSPSQFGRALSPATPSLPEESALIVESDLISEDGASSPPSKSKKSAKQKPSRAASAGASASAQQAATHYEDFIPTVSVNSLLPDDIGFSKVQANVKQSKKSKRKSGASGKRSNAAKPTLSEKATRAIGEQGEKIVYKKLVNFYHKKYPKSTIRFTEKGFIVQGLDNADNPLTLEVHWCNKRLEKGVVYAAESGSHYDFKIIRNGRKRIVEVKSTLTSDKREFDMSGYEYDKMQKYQDRYRFFRVYSVDTKKPRIEKIKNPAEDLKNNKIRVKGIRLKI